MIAMRMEIILNACNEDTNSESDAEHQASGASSSAMNKKTSLDNECWTAKLKTTSTDCYKAFV